MKILFSALSLGLLVDSAHAQEICMEHGKFVDFPKEQYDEIPVGIGMVNKTAEVELLVGKDKTWTAIVTHTDGMSCMVAAGNSWETMDLPKDNGN